MSEEALQRFLERLNADEDFREKTEEDWEGTLAEFELSPAERVAVATGD